jgi:hypothetical protein
VAEVPQARRRTDQAMAEPAAADDEVLLGLGYDITKVENRTYLAYQRLRNFACVCPLRPTMILLYLKADPKGATGW